MAKTRTCVVLQPGYLPWLGFFEQMNQADEFVLLDDVQYDRNGWRNRNRIKAADGPQWLTVPVHASLAEGTPLRDVRIDESQSRWAARHLNALKTNYAPCSHFAWLYPEIDTVLRRAWTHLVDLDEELIALLCDKLGLRRRIHRASELGVVGERSERLVEMCRVLHCDRYYSGAAAREYLDVQRFQAAGINVEFQDYVHPCYAQRGEEFVSHLSCVDLMFNVGPRSLRIITQPDCTTSETVNGEQRCTATAL